MLTLALALGIILLASIGSSALFVGGLRVAKMIQEEKQPQFLQREIVAGCIFLISAAVQLVACIVINLR
jgi:hypothetical protein